jgi:hypothetical protein
MGHHNTPTGVKSILVRQSEQEMSNIVVSGGVQCALTRN